MAEIIFDSRNQFFKTPQGAVKAGTELTFRLLAAQELHPIAVRLIIQYDRHDMPAVYEMNGGMETPAQTDDYLEYFVTFRIHDTGLYWYHFEVKTPDVVIKVNPERTDLIETRNINGRDCLVIELSGGVVVNGITVRNAPPAEEEEE